MILSCILIKKNIIISIKNLLINNFKDIIVFYIKSINNKEIK